MKVIPNPGNQAPATPRQRTGGSSSRISAAIAAFNNGSAPAESTSSSESVANSSENGHSDTIEAPTSGATAETKAPEEPISSQYAVLARKEKALRAERTQFLKDREEFNRAKEEASKPKAPTFDESKYISRDKFSEDPFSALEELGLDYDKLTEKALNAPSSEQREQQRYIKQLEARLAQIDEKLEKTNKTFEQRDLEAKEQTIVQLRSETKRLVESNEAFETIKETGSINDVVELIERTFADSGELLSVEEAAQAVEDHLVEEAMKLTKIKKIQLRMQAANKPAETKTTDISKQQQVKTLSNTMSAAPKLTARERALRRFNGENF